VALKIVTHAERPEFREQWGAAFLQVWPEIMHHAPVCNQYWGGLTRYFPECQIYLIDDMTDALVGIGNTVPLTWDGTTAGLPGGVDDVLTATIGNRASQPPTTTLCALQAGLLAGHKGKGLSTVIVRAMREIAERRGYADLIAPVRPNQKSLYPLTPMERYVQWRRSDGLPLDAWMRVHARLGASVMHVAEQSMIVEGTVAEWEAWTGLSFPDSGEYVVAGALVPISIDREADRGQYVEPNVWMRHPI
jgi:hypothetical protein